MEDNKQQMHGETRNILVILKSGGRLRTGYKFIDQTYQRNQFPPDLLQNRSIQSSCPRVPIELFRRAQCSKNIRHFAGGMHVTVRNGGYRSVGLMEAKQER